MPAMKGKPAEMITPEEVAARMGTSAAQVRNELQRGTFPIGWAENPTGRQWVYHIIRAEFEEMMAGRLPTNQKRMAKMIAEELAVLLSAVGL